MADSDDEQDRSRGRDKFRRERSDYSSGDRNRRGEKRTWRDDSDSYASRRRSRDDYENEGRKRFSGGSGYGHGHGGRDWSPPPKRMRREQWSGFPVPGMMMPYGIRPPWSLTPHPAHQMSPNLSLGSDMGGDSSRSSKRGMLTFKQFLAQQEDDIDEADAITSYNKYKAEFKKKVVEEFFEEHKEEDWLISMYHPKKVKQNKEKEANNLQSRVKAFTYLLESGLLENVSLSVDNSEEITKVMDSAVIKMEGGSDLDLLCLEGSWKDKREGEQREKKAKEDSPSFLTMEETDESKKLAEQAREYGRQRQSNEGSSDSGLSGDGEEGDKPAGEDHPASEANREGASTSSAEATENGVGSGDTKPRLLHITRSVYIRHIPAKISTEDIIEVCRAIPGFLRLALADPAPDKQYERRGWATYTSETDIKEVTARLSSAKIKDTQLGCMPNRDLNRRVKHSSAASWARKALHSDLQHVIKLIKFLDEKLGLWEYASGEENEVKLTNPVLSFPESLLDEEPVSMATSGDDEEGAINDPGTEIVDTNDEKLQLLDRLVWYLRIVHSLDYYTGTVFPSEDSMPHRCGLFTVRPHPPDSINHQEVSEYVDSMVEKVKPLLVKKETLSDAEIIKLGKKDPEAEMERFVEMNTQKLAENKYLCPLSGKKFKGPEFVRKHIFNKHMDKVEAFKQEAEFFNSYIRDADRPMPLETAISSSLPTTPKTPGSEESPSGGGVLGSGGSPWGQGRLGMYGRGGGFSPAMGGGFNPSEMMNRGSGGYRGRGGRRGRGRRPVVNYHDLDAPDEMY